MELSVKKVPPEREIESGKKGQKKERKRSLSALSQKRADSCDEGNDGALSLSLWSVIPQLAAVVVVAAVRRKRRRKRKRSVKVYFFKKKVPTFILMWGKKVVVFGEEKQFCAVVLCEVFFVIFAFFRFSAPPRGA